MIAGILRDAIVRSYKLIILLYMNIFLYQFLNK
jgi:hypothetical protein